MINTKAKAVSAPTPGCVRKRRASGHFSTSCSITCVRSVMVGFSRSSSCSRSSRRRLAQGANRNDSSCSRPCCRHNLFLQRSPSFRATACNRRVHKERLVLQDLAKDEWILFPKRFDPVVFEAIMDAAQCGSIAPKHAHDVIAPQQAADLVSEHVGVAILTQPSATGFHADGVVVKPLSDTS